MGIIKFNNTRVFGVLESIKASGYPMSTEIDETLIKSDWDRMEKLSNAQIGSGHNSALKGIVVQTDVTAPQYWWQQAQRYHFFDIVSSQSKMHKINQMDLDASCNKWVTKSTIDNLKTLVDIYNNDKSSENFQIVMSNCPMGLLLTARVTTNYLQLKTMYKQRKHHPLQEWKLFNDWIIELPYSKYIIGKE